MLKLWQMLDENVIDKNTRRAIVEILNRGNDVEIKRNGTGCTVSEIKQVVKYRSGKVE